MKTATKWQVGLGVAALYFLGVAYAKTVETNSALTDELKNSYFAVSPEIRVAFLWIVASLIILIAFIQVIYKT